MTAYAEQDSDAPGRADGAEAQPAPAEGAPPPAGADQATEGADGAEGPPPPQGEPPSFFSGTTLLLFAVPLLLVFMMSRSQNKKQQKLESSLSVGDRVVTRAGMVGKIVELNDRQAKLEIAPGVHVSFLKGAIEGLDAGDKDKDKGDVKKVAEKEKDKADTKKESASDDDVKVEAKSKKGKAGRAAEKRA